MNHLSPSGDAALPVAAPRSRQPWSWVVGLALAIIACAVLTWVWKSYSQAPLANLPVISLDRSGPDERKTIEEAEKLVKRKPRSGPAWGRLGMVLLAHNFEDAAITCFSVAQTLDRSTARWPYCAGVGLAISDPEKALIHFARASELAPGEPWPKFRQAELLMDLHRLDEADQILQTISGAEHADRLTYDRVRLALLRGPEALRKLEPTQLKRLQSVSNRRAGLELLVQVWRRLGEAKDAEALTQRLRSEMTGSEGWEDPYVADIMSLRQDPLWQAELARHAFDAGQTDDAVQRMAQLVADYPDDPQWSLQLAHMWGELRQRAKAVAVLEQAVQHFPNSAAVHFELGNQQFQLQDWPAAVGSYAAATRLKPDYGLAHYNLGQTHLKLGHNADALAAFRDALRCQPDLAAAHVNLGDILSQTGKPPDMEEARQHLERAVKLAPRDKRAVELLNQLPKP